MKLLHKIVISYIYVVVDKILLLAYNAIERGDFMNLIAEFATRLRERREKMGLTQTALAKKIGVSPQMISAYEKNIHGEGKTPTLDKVLLLADVLEVPIDWLLGVRRSRLSFAIETYSDLVSCVEAIASAVDAETNIDESWDPYTETHSMYAFMRIDDEFLARFFERRYKMAGLLKDGTLDEKLYQSWLDGELAKLEKTDIPQEEAPLPF